MFQAVAFLLTFKHLRLNVIFVILYHVILYNAAFVAGTKLPVMVSALQMPLFHFACNKKRRKTLLVSVM